MKILLDHDGLSGLYFAWETSDHSMHYLAAAPALTIVVFQNGLDPKSLAAAVVEAQISEQTGLENQVHTGNAGQAHSFILVSERVDGPPDMTLSHLLAIGRQQGV